MIKRFYAWLIYTSICVVSFGYGVMKGPIVGILEQDTSPISLTILALVFFYIGYTGWYMYRNDRSNGRYDEFFSKMTMRIGLFGTVYGLVLIGMNIPWEQIDFTDVSTAREILVEMPKGTMIALVTTLVGLAGSLFIGFSRFIGHGR